jgi:glycerol transport system ATP-binding protein
VAENLAFPLKNRKVPADRIKTRVGQIAEMLEMSHQLDMRAAGLSADQKQKISLGRGLVRPDVSAVLFDEPLTVIDPHLKWQLRRKLKQIHHELKLTLIYVTHDQVEALTFAEQVVVMTRGKVVQMGSPEALFERPAHRFVGHFIGSPGMNFVPATVTDGQVNAAGYRLGTLGTGEPRSGELTLGIRPEYLGLVPPGDAGSLPARVRQVQDIGTYVLVSLDAAGMNLKARLSPEAAAPRVGDTVGAQVLNAHTCCYNQNEELVP